MASPNKITREITLEGQIYKLAIDLNFYRTFHAITGKDLLSGGFGSDYSATPDEIVAMLYASLKSGGGVLSMDDVGSLLHPGNLQYAMEELRAVIAANAPAPEAGGNDPLAERVVAAQRIG